MRPNVDLLVVLRRVGDEVAGLSFVQEAVHLPRDDGDRPRLVLRIHFLRTRLERLAVGRERTQVAHGIPAKRHEMLLKEECVGVTGLASVDAPHRRFVRCHVIDLLRRRSAKTLTPDAAPPTPESSRLRISGRFVT